MCKICKNKLIDFLAKKKNVSNSFNRPIECPLDFGYSKYALLGTQMTDPLLEKYFRFSDWWGTSGNQNPLHTLANSKFLLQYDVTSTRTIFLIFLRDVGEVENTIQTNRIVLALSGFKVRTFYGFLSIFLQTWTKVENNNELFLHPPNGILLTL